MAVFFTYLEVLSNIPANHHRSKSLILKPLENNHTLKIFHFQFFQLILRGYQLPCFFYIFIYNYIYN